MSRVERPNEDTLHDRLTLFIKSLIIIFDRPKWILTIHILWQYFITRFLIIGRQEVKNTACSVVKKASKARLFWIDL